MLKFIKYHNKQSKKGVISHFPKGIPYTGDAWTYCPQQRQEMPDLSLA